MCSSAVVRVCASVFLFAAILGGLSAYAEDTPEIAAFRVKAENGDKDAQMSLFLIYMGAGDLKQAVKWTIRLAEQGDSTSQFFLGTCYLRGDGVPKDSEQAMKWYRKAAEQGHVEAQYTLGQHLLFGAGVSKDEEDAAKWFRKAAEQGYVEGQLLLGLCYVNGLGVQKDLKEAAEWYRKAAEQGSAQAEYLLANFYWQGIGVQKDEEKALEWFRKAAQQGEPESQMAVGIFYQRGLVVKKDVEQAVVWVRKAAEQGYANAQLIMGTVYRKGEGVPKDLVQAYMWLNLAAAQSNEDAANNRTEIEQEMTPDQIAQAQRLSADFAPKSGKKGEKPPQTDNSPTSIPCNLVGSGTGFFVTSDGWFVANAHVVKVGSKATVKLGDKLLPAVVKQLDLANDLALIKVEGQFDALAVERARTVSLGTSVFTVGFPNPGLQGFSPKMTKGEISSMAGVKDDPRHFQVSLPIQPGNSGGALADASGNVVGVITAMISDAVAIETSGAIPQNVNYAIKSTYLLALVESIPEVAKGLKDPVKAQDFTVAVQAVEKASAMVLMFE